MTKAQRINEIVAQLEVWAQHIKAIDAQYNALSAITGTGVGSPLWDAIFAMQNAYTASVSERVGDTNEWLNFYEFDCEMGKHPRVVSNLMGNRSINVKTMRDLARVICD